MTEVKNPRAIEMMQVLAGLSCLKSLNKNDLKSLNLDYLTEIVTDTKEECNRYLEKYSGRTERSP